MIVEQQAGLVPEKFQLLDLIDDLVAEPCEFVVLVLPVPLLVPLELVSGLLWELQQQKAVGVVSVLAVWITDF